jgi:hypothetical protein
VDVVAIGIAEADFGNEFANLVPPALDRGHLSVPGSLRVPFVLHARKVPRICVEGRTSPRLLKLCEEIGIDHLGSLFLRFRSHMERTLSLFR